MKCLIYAIKLFIGDSIMLTVCAFIVGKFCVVFLFNALSIGSASACPLPTGFPVFWNHFNVVLKFATCCTSCFPYLLFKIFLSISWRISSCCLVEDVKRSIPNYSHDWFPFSFSSVYMSAIRNKDVQLGIENWIMNFCVLIKSIF